MSGNIQTKELLKKVRKIEIKTKGLSNQIFSGEYHSAFKGKGMAFSEVREYMPGDEIRTIDWNVTARFNHPYIKVFEEEREMTVMLLVDVSGSEFFGTRHQLKKDLIIEVCAVLAFSAINNNDKIGVIFFSNQVEKFIPPKKGRSHILRIIRELLDFQPLNQGTDINEALRFLNNAIKKKSTAFVLSDFIGKDFSTSLKIANKKHDIVALQVHDKGEDQLPDLGLVPFQDAETGKVSYVNTSSHVFRLKYAASIKQRQENLIEVFRKAGVDFTRLETDKSYVTPLMNLFKAREHRR